MTKSKTVYTINDLLERAGEYISDSNQINMIEKAYNYALSKHNGDSSSSGEDCIIHDINTAIILTTVYADSDTICAGLLHDILDYNKATSEEIEREFGHSISSLVVGVSKIGSIHFSTETEAMTNYYKKIIVGMCEDVRVIIIKLADRLHDMRTLWMIPEDKQKIKAKETLEILTPLAHHLGIHKIKSELEDLSLRYLKPDVFYDIAEKLNTTKLERDLAVIDMINTVSSLLKEHNIAHDIKGRSKSIYSIYKKLEDGRKFSDIYDLLALRLLVNDEAECYSIIGIIHSKFRPVPKRFKDYIAMPKPNGYRSLHTTVVGIDGYLFEIQIRTYEMDELAENGVASHWAYKEKKNLGNTSINATELKLQIFKSIVESNEDKMSSEDFISNVKDEILGNEIYVYTPKGDIFELPRGATPIDFAYRVHTQIGNTMVGAIVNDNIVSLNYVLQDGDVVKINTNKASAGPNKEWLKIATMTQTRNKIKAFFAKTERERYIDKGKVAIERELRKNRMSFTEFFTNENIDKILKETKVSDFDEIYLCIGNNKYSSTYIIGIVKKDDKPLIDESKLTLIPKNTDNDIIVAGIDNIKVNIASCCNPIPGDSIVGYITKGNGISVHRRECHNLEYLDNRMVNVSWSSNPNNKYIATLFVYADNDERAINDIKQKASTSNIKIDSIKKVVRVDEVLYEIDVWLKDTTHLNNYTRDLEAASYIHKVVRIIK